MLPVKFQDHMTYGSGEEDLYRFLLYCHGGHLGHVTWTIFINFRSPSQRGSTYNLALNGQSISGKKMFKNNGHIRGAIQNYVDFFYNFKTENQPHIRLGIHIIKCIWQVFAKF